jgi:hypothetical protein
MLDFELVNINDPDPIGMRVGSWHLEYRTPDGEIETVISQALTEEATQSQGRSAEGLYVEGSSISGTLRWRVGHLAQDMRAIYCMGCDNGQVVFDLPR